MLTVGPAGTGKTRAVLTKLRLCAEKYPGFRGLITRQTRESCTDTCLVTWENEVLGADHPVVGKTARQNRHSYRFGNGSEVVVLGLDKPSKLFSSEYDFIYVNEAVEIAQDTWESFGRALRHFKMPYQQLIGDTNPDHPAHWLKKKIDAGVLCHIPTTHKDNRAYWDEEKGDWTPAGRAYMDRLKAMTGSRYTRLYLGEWGVAEGARWPNLDPQTHRFSREEMFPNGIPEFYTKWVSIDHGFGNPYAALWHCADSEGNVYTYREDYGEGFTADAQAERVVERSPLNENYYAEYLDPSMWHQDPRARGKMQGEISAADLYDRRFRQEDVKERFGPVLPGSRVTRLIGFSTLDSLLGRDNGHPNWYIDHSCKNLWDELIGASLKKNATSGIVTEDLDPKCPDHAITSAIYGLHTHYEVPKGLEENPLANFDPIKYNQELRRLQEEESVRNFERRHSKNIRF